MPSSALFNLLGHSSFGAFTFGRLSYHPKWFIFNVLIIVYAQIKRCDVILFSKMCFNNDLNIFLKFFGAMSTNEAAIVNTDEVVNTDKTNSKQLVCLKVQEQLMERC